MAPLLSEFVATTVTTLDQLPPLDSKGCLRNNLQGIPQSSKMLSFEKIGGGEVKTKFRCKFGIYRSPVIWLKDARELAHPFDQYHAVPDKMLEVVFNMLTMAPDVVARQRAHQLKTWMSWASELEASEKSHKLSLEEGVRAILQPKKLLLLKRIAESLDWRSMPVSTLWDYRALLVFSA